MLRDETAAREAVDEALDDATAPTANSNLETVTPSDTAKKVLSKRSGASCCGQKCLF